MANNIEVIPGFWGSMLQGFNQGNATGQENYWRRQQQDAAEKARQEALRMQGFQIASGLYQQGNMGPAQMQTAAQGMSDILPFLKNAQFAENPAWLKNQMAVQPEMSAPTSVPGMGAVPSMPRFTETQYNIAGVESPTERTTKRKIAEVNQRIGSAQATKMEHEASPQMLNVNTYNQLSQAFDNIANSAANDALSSVGGIAGLNAKNISGLPDIGMRRVEESGVLARFGAMSPEQKAQVKGMIADRLNDAYLKWFTANTQRMSALNQGNQTGSPWDRVADNLLQQGNAVMERMKILQKDNAMILGPMGEMMVAGLSKGNKQEEQRMRSVIEEYRALQARQARLSQLSAKATLQEPFTAEDRSFLFGGNTSEAVNPNEVMPSEAQLTAGFYMLPPESRAALAEDQSLPENVRKLYKGLLAKSQQRTAEKTKRQEDIRKSNRSMYPVPPHP